MFPVRSLFQPRVGEDAKAEFRIQLSQPVYAAQKLSIICQASPRNVSLGRLQQCSVLAGTAPPT